MRSSTLRYLFEKQADQEIQPPPVGLALTDGLLALQERPLSATALVPFLPKARAPHRVMIIPGFLGNDLTSRQLVRLLTKLGYEASGWELGRNLGTSSITDEMLKQRLLEVSDDGKRSITLIGHSLGGLYSREIARAVPELVRQVITLGSPFGRGQSHASRVGRLYDLLNRDQPKAADDALVEPPPVPTTAIYTRSDGVVNWRTTRQDSDYPEVRNIEVPGSHSGLIHNSVVWYFIAHLLAQTEVK